MLFQHAHGGRRTEHHRHAVLLHQAPQHGGVRLHRRAFVHQRGHASDEGPVDDIAVAHDPADVAGGEIGLAGLATEDPVHAGRQGHRIAADVALHALRFPRRAAGVEGIARRVGLQPGTGYAGPVVLTAQLGVVQVAAGHALEGQQAAVHHQHGGRLVGRQRDGLVQQWLVGDALAGTAAGIGADDELRRRVLDAAGQAHRREAAEHHRMDGAYPRAGQHREGGLRDHRHIDQDAVARPHALGRQHGGHGLHFGLQGGEAVDHFLAHLSRHPDQRAVAGPRGRMAVHRVVTEVGGAPDKPARERRLAGVADLPRRRPPIDTPGLLGPEGVTLDEGASVEIGVGLRAHGDQCVPEPLTSV